MIEKFIPNIITILRLLAIPPAILFMWNDQFSVALFIFAIAGVSDGVDGYLARRFHWESPWGAAMDPIADKALLVSTAAMLTYKDLLPGWLFILMLGRDATLLGGSFLYRIKFGPFDVQPSMLGKISTFIQILLLLSLMIHVAYGILTLSQLDVLILLCTLATLVSGLHYLWVWIRKALNE